MEQYDIFISCSQSDLAEVNALIDRVRNNIPGIRIFYDNRQNQLLDVDRSKIIKAIDDSSLVIFVVSENSLSNEDCEKEVMYAKNTSKRVVPYLLQGMSLKGWLLFELGRVNSVNSTNQQDVALFIEALKQRFHRAQGDNYNNTFSSDIPSDNQVNTYVENSFLGSNDTIETQLVFDHRTGEFVSRITGGDPSSNQPSDLFSTDSSESTNESQGFSESFLSNGGAEPQKKLYLNGHEYVDLGLPSRLKWATCNVGSYKPEESGLFFAWGEVKSKSTFTPEKSETYRKDKEWLGKNGYIGYFGNLTLNHDAARKNWGSTWRMPTKKEIEELKNHTTFSWHRVNGVDGCQLKSKINGNCIFLPAFGKEEGFTLKDKGILGMFWSSTASDINATDSCRLAVGINLFSVRETSRYIGLNIRPVSE